MMHIATSARRGVAKIKSNKIGAMDNFGQSSVAIRNEHNRQKSKAGKAISCHYG
jgi:hypothetical protein